MRESFAPCGSPPAKTGARGPARIRVLTFTTLYPNGERPHHGIFVENRLRQLLTSGRVSARVVAPVPWFPSRNPLFGRYAELARAPDREERYGVLVDHPRYTVMPKFGMTLAPWTLYRAAKRRIRRLVDEGVEFDIIDAHYFYPDGVAAALLGRHFCKPVVITARGSDINLIPDHAVPRRMIRWAADRAAGSIAVCGALREEMIRIGIDGNRISVLRNGVDLGLFRPLERRRAREALSLDGTALLSAGHLISRKGHDLVIRALRELPDAKLIVVGEGPEESSLRALARKVGVAQRVHFLGRVAHDEMPAIYSAADVLVLASSREGWANVLLESMACGTPVVATDIWGTREAVTAPEAGVLVRERTPDALAAGIRKILASQPDRKATRAYAERFSWDATTAGQLEIFYNVINALQR